MPFEMSDYVQSVVVQGKVYVGGGEPGYAIDNSYIVMEYDTRSGKWAELPPYKVHHFTMTVINNQLVLVGGWKGVSSKILSVWRAESTKWMYPYPDMPTARSAVVHHKWLVVAGGWWWERRVSSVEIMNTNTKQWFAGPSTPMPWMGMKTAIVGDTCYFMGGVRGTASEIYHVSLPALISRLHYKESSGKDNEHQIIWKMIPKSPNMYSAPLSISGYLLSVGGAETSIYFYHPDTEEWVKVGDLPTSQRDCTCAVITEKEIIVAGGGTTTDMYTASVFIGRMSTPPPF